jgi:hypothetical protein
VLARGEFTPRVGRLGWQRPGVSGSGSGGGAAGTVNFLSSADGSAPVAIRGSHQQQQRPQSAEGQGAEHQHQRHPHAARLQPYYNTSQQSPPNALAGSPGRPQAAGAAHQLLDGSPARPSPAAAYSSQPPDAADGTQRVPSSPVSIRPNLRSPSSVAGSNGTPGVVGSWAAGAHSGARRVRFGADALHGNMVLKPRLMDPDEDEGGS